MRLTDLEIVACLEEGSFVIDSRPDAEVTSGVCVDVKLSNQFRVFQDHTVPYIDLSGPSSEVQVALDRVMSDKIVLKLYNSGKLPLALKPMMIIGAINSERLSLPVARPYNKRKSARYRDQQAAVASRISQDK